MFISLIALSLSFALEPKKAYLSERIEARVGSQIITSTDLAYKRENLLREIKEPKSEQELKSRALDFLVEQALIREFLSKSQMSVSDQEVERRLNGIRQSSGAQSAEQFQQMLAAQVINLEQFKSQIREQLEAQEFLGVLKRQTVQTMNETELKAYYQNNLSRFQTNYEIDLEECLIPFSSNEAEMRKIADRYIQKKAPFSECVKKYSRSPSAANGGQLGKVRQGVLREDVDRLVFGLSAGSIASVELPGAIQLLRVVSKKDLGARKFEDVRGEIEQLIERDRILNTRDRMLAELRATTFVKVGS